MKMRSAAWADTGMVLFHAEVLLGGSNVRVDRKFSLQELAFSADNWHAYRRLHESALYNLLSCATPPCIQLRRTGASLAYLGTNHLIPIRNSPAIPLFLKQPYWQVAADTVCFDVGVPLLYGSRQATLFFPFRVVTCTYKAKIDLAVPAWPSPLIIVNCTINLSYGLLVL